VIIPAIFFLGIYILINLFYHKWDMVDKVKVNTTRYLKLLDQDVRFDGFGWSGSASKPAIYLSFFFGTLTAFISPFGVDLYEKSD